MSNMLSNLQAFVHMVPFAWNARPMPFPPVYYQGLAQTPRPFCSSTGLGRGSSSVDGPLAVSAIIDVLSWEV